MKQLQIAYMAKSIANQVQALLPNQYAHESVIEASLQHDIGFRAKLVWQLQHLDPFYTQAYEPLMNQINCLDCKLQ